MGRLIDADALLKNKTDHEMISTHMIYNAPTVEVIPRERIEQMAAEILMKNMDRTICGEKPLTATDCVAIIRKYTKEQNNEPN